MQNRLRILLSNDDGYASSGIKFLYDSLNTCHDVVVVAPCENQSGIGHAFTFNRPLSYSMIPEQLRMRGYMVRGTPSDCVKFAVSYLLPQKPDVVISGMNEGENSGLSGFYSGTVAAAREGAFWGIPSFAFSVCTAGLDFLADYSRRALLILENILTIRVSFEKNTSVYFNVNFPGCSPDICRGIKVTRQSCAFFDDRYKRVAIENAKEGFIIYGEKKEVEDSEVFDSRALVNNFTTITPLCFDATANWLLPHLTTMER